MSAAHALGVRAQLAQSKLPCEHPTCMRWLCHYKKVLGLGGPWLGPHFTMESGHLGAGCSGPPERKESDILLPRGSLSTMESLTILHPAPPKKAKREAEFYCIHEVSLYYHGAGDVDISLAKKLIFLFKKLYSSHRFHRLYSSKREMYALYKRGWMPAKIAVNVLQDFLFLTFLLTIKIWHFHSTMLILSSLCSCIVGEWHPLIL